MEVNLAILIMAGGILSVVGLYSLGFRENRQSAEDVSSAAYAESIISPLMMALSATNLKWSVFKNEWNYPGPNGWGEYFNSDGIVDSNPEPKAMSAFGSAMGVASSAASGSLDARTSWPGTTDTSMKAGLVVMHEEGSAIVKIGFRATKQPGMLLSAPLYYTEVRFQGIADE